MLFLASNLSQDVPLATRTFSHEKVNVDRIRDLLALILSIIPVRDLDILPPLSDSNAITVTRACVKRIAHSQDIRRPSFAVDLQDSPEKYLMADSKLKEPAVRRNYGMYYLPSVHILLSFNPSPLPFPACPIIFDFDPMH